MTSASDTHLHDKTSPLAFSAHDHSKCIESTLATAEELCARDGLRLTPVRRKVLEILLEHHKAMGAYAILELLRDAGFGSQPPVAYRALDFLTEHGLAHKIEVLNAYVACSDPAADHAPAFMICTECDAVAEAPAALLNKRLDAEAKTSGFKIARTVVEAQGICPLCADETDA